MVEDPVTPERLEAGQAYIDALTALGFQPDRAAWVIHLESNVLQLALVTDLVDRVGPLTMQEALFKAYENAKTPQSFDPWLVTLFSPETFFAIEMGSGSFVSSDPGFVEQTPETYVSTKPMRLKVVDWETRPGWMYPAPQKHFSADAQLRKWRGFTREIAQAA